MSIPPRLTSTEDILAALRDSGGTAGCVFCGIVAGTEPATIVREWPDALAFVPLGPVVNGHTLVIPRQHIANATKNQAITALTMARAAELAARWPSSNILTSVGAPAKQSVFHLHIHVIPRAEGDQLMVPWGTTGNPHDPHWCRVAERYRDPLAELVRLKDGARDEAYRAAKDAAWMHARAVLDKERAR